MLDTGKKLYETTVVFDGSKTDEEIENLKKWINDLLVSHKIEVKNTVIRGRMKLAYPIKKKTTGYYMHIEFIADPDTIHEIERRFRLNESILRYLTIILSNMVLAIRERVVKYGAGISTETTSKEEDKISDKQGSEDKTLEKKPEESIEMSKEKTSSESTQST